LTPAELCVVDPVNVGIHSHKKCGAILNKLIVTKETTRFGTVERVSE